MDVNNTINSFESKLRCYKANKVLLYSDNMPKVCDYPAVSDVIDNVSRQIKTMNNAAFVKKTSTNQKMIDYKKSEFIPLNLLLEPEQKSITPYETQYPFNTQLLNIVQDVEENIDVQTGVTQEFELSFDDVTDKIRHNKNPVEDKEAISQVFEKYEVIQRNKEIIPSDNKIVEKKYTVNETINQQEHSMSTKNEKKSMNIFEENENKRIDIEENCLSPVLKTKTKVHRSHTYKLDSFEKFEALAGPIVQENTDLEEVRKIINSQIMNNELFLDCNGGRLREKYNQLSQLLQAKTESTEVCQVDKSNIKNISIDDDIFISDEETDYNCKNKDDIPMTSVSEASFNTQMAVLDKTMYVGFQTASNKSIQVLTDSYCKARNVFDDLNSKPMNSFSLTELVNMYDDPFKSMDVRGNMPISEIDVSRVDAIEKTTKHNKVEAVCVIPTQFSEKPTHKNSDVEPKSLEKEHDVIGCNTDCRNNESFNVNYQSDKTCRNVKNFHNCQEKNLLVNRITTHKYMSEDHLNIDESILQEFEENLLYADDHKLHTNSRDDSRLFSMKYRTTGAKDSISLPYEVTNSCFNGFVTASNKQIKVSEESLNKMKNIFKDIDFHDIGNTSPQTKTEQRVPFDETKFKVFKTASNKDIPISKYALAKSKVIFNEIENLNLVESSMCKQIVSNSVINTENDINVKEDKTTVNKLSESVDDRNRDMVINFNKQFQTDILETDNFNGHKIFQGFKTASNKIIHISDEVLAKTKIVFKDDLQICETPLNENITNTFKNEFYASNTIMSGKECDTIESNRRNDKIESRNKLCIGFKTASNKIVTTSSEALAKSKKLFQDILINDQNHTGKSTSANTFIGFKTASNKKVHISEKALQKGKKIFENLDLVFDSFNEHNNTIETNTKESKGKYVNSNNSKLGQTSLEMNTKMIDNTTVDTSKDLSSKIIAHNNYNHIFKGCQTEKSDILNTNDNKNEHRVFEGLKMASHKPVHISEQAIATTKKVFENLEDIHMSDKLSLNESIEIYSREKHVPTNASEIGNNKCIKIFNEPIVQAKQILDNVDSKHLEHETTEFKNKLFKGITMVNNALTMSSHDAETHFNQKIDDKLSNTDDQNKCKSFIGFKKASNKKVNISDEALEKSKKILDKIDLGTSLAKLTSCKSKNHDDDGLKESNSDETNNLKLAQKNKDFDGPVNNETLTGFEETLYTEDFLKKSPVSKRSSSPILSCPRAKKIRSIGVREIKFNDNLEKLHPYKFNKDYKKFKQYTLKDMKKIEDLKSNLKYNYDTILNFEFKDVRNEIANSKWTMRDIKQYFMCSVNNKIIPNGWIDNHLKLLMLKLIFYEETFPFTLGVVCTVKNIMEQLKYRYDKELYNVERPALRKILERDEVPSRRIVLRVINIYSDGVSAASPTNVGDNVELLVSDGWYALKATVDRMLAKLVQSGQIVVGTKLVTHGAELVNGDQGVAPWEDTSSIRLKIFGNSTRRAHYTARLGFYGNGAILSPLTAVKPEGGKISRLRLFVTRMYPMLFVEKFEDGSTVTRSERLEALHQMKYETEREILLEKMYEEVEKEFSKQDFQGSQYSQVDTRNVESGSQIWRLMRGRDSGEYTTTLTHSQTKLLQEYTARHRESTLQEMQAKVQELMKGRGLDVVRNVVPMLKIRVADVHEDKVTKAMITIWRPNESLLDMIREGAWVDVYNVVPTAVRYSEIQISAGRQSVFRKSSKINEKKSIVARTLQRKCYTICELTQNPTITTDYNEIDTAGFVFDIEPSIKDFDKTKQLFQNVYLADDKKKIICINFWGGLKKFGFENILGEGQIVACVNLQKRSGNTRKNIPQFRATELSYFTQTCKLDQVRNYFNDLSIFFSNLDKKEFIRDSIAKRNIFVKKSNIENISPYHFNNADYSLSRNRAFIDSPMDLNLDLAGLDFESTFKQTDDTTPNRLARKRKTDEKIAILKRYGEPPSLSAIHIINKSKDATRPYKSPLFLKDEHSDTNRSAKITPSNVNLKIDLKPKSIVSTPSATSIERKINNRQCTSPVLWCRTRSVNPVKLNFSEQNEDPFGEDFDTSPPLSLDSCC